MNERTTTRRPAAQERGPRVLRRLLRLSAAVGLVAGLLACEDHDHFFFSSPPQNGYVGSTVCGQCHGPYHPTTNNGTRHADWLLTAHGETADATPSEASIDADSDANGQSDFKDGLDLSAQTSWSQYTSGGGASSTVAPILGFDAARAVYTLSLAGREFDVAQVVGVGRHRQVFLTQLGSSLYVLPVLYDVDEALTADRWKPFEPESWFTWTDANSDGLVDAGEAVTGVVYPTLSETPLSVGKETTAWEVRCVGCHVTGMTSLTQSAAGEFVAAYSEVGVGCEACHGPGRTHASDLGGRSTQPGRSIVNPATLTAAQQEAICLGCHTRGVGVGTVGGQAVEFPLHADGTFFAPGEATVTTSLLPKRKVNETLHPLQGDLTHQGFPCQTCHTPHDATNIKNIRSSIDTPNSGARAVLFTTRSGLATDPGVMGSKANGVLTDVCEVCHTTTRYLLGDGTGAAHNDGKACTDCHKHDRAFAPPESPGGIDCSNCHLDLTTAMTAASGASYHHHLADTGTTYPLASGTKRCLSCHADHDVFSPLVGGAGRGGNLRTDIGVAPSLGTPTTFSNTDFVAAATSGGVCLSCHTSLQARSNVGPDGVNGATAAIPLADPTTPVATQITAYSQSTHGGAFTVTSTFADSGTNTFDANCSKCHNDTLNPKSAVGGQTGAPFFGDHTSSLGRILAELGIASPTDPTEEQFCFRCHSQTTDAVGGTVKSTAGQDWYGVTTMQSRSEGIFAALAQTHKHPVTDPAMRGRHAPDEGTTNGWNPSSSRHVECVDCHNPHASRGVRGYTFGGTFAQPPTPLVRATTDGPLFGVWGVNVTWPGTSWATPAPATAYTRVTSSETWQVCLKCHSGYAYDASPPAGETDQAKEFNPNNPAYHNVVGNRTATAPSTSFVFPWLNDSVLNCYDCHTNGDQAGSQGPHGAAIEGLLPGDYDATTGSSGTQDHLCFKCHDYGVYSQDAVNVPSDTGFSNAGKNLHFQHMSNEIPGQGFTPSCQLCHVAIPHGYKNRAMLAQRPSVDPESATYAPGSIIRVNNWGATSGSWSKSDCDYWNGSGWAH